MNNLFEFRGFLEKFPEESGYKGMDIVNIDKKGIYPFRENIVARPVFL
jgi:hypothetical protein